MNGTINVSLFSVALIFNHCASENNGDLHNLYLSPDIIRQIKSRRMRWAGHVARTGRGEKPVQGFDGKA
jgi:hypothetical protein